MRAFRIIGTGICFPALAVITFTLHAQTSEEEERRRLDSLVRQLGDKKYAKRQAAGKELEGLGEKALPTIRKAEADKDLDLGSLARQVARSIMRANGKSKSTGLETLLVEEGRFEMGSPPFEYGRRPDEALHPVRITRPFLIGKYEVTQAEYGQVMKLNPSWFSAKGSGRDKVAGLNTDQFPVENMTWFDAIEFCNRLSVLDGYPPYYKLAGVKTQGDFIVAAEVSITGGNGYRLPTEAEWEFACRAWSTTSFYFGSSNTGVEANLKPGPSTGYGGGPNWTVLNRTARVGDYKANHRGLHEQHGNVAEWCWDWYNRDYYSTSLVDDPAGPEKGTHRAVRGGSWLLQEGSCRSASRLMVSPGDRFYTTGFRVARTP